jgi:predicted Zn-dependent protease with MMP-like domain
MESELFEALVLRAVEKLPDEFRALMENVDVVVAEYPTAAQNKQAGPGHTLLGLYEGVPRTVRGAHYQLVTPDKITIFQRPIESICASPEELMAEVQRVVRHEIAHHFGLSDAELSRIEKRRRPR